MYVHLGGGCLIRATLSENGIIDSIVLTENKMYLSAISSSTLQKRVNQNLIYNNGGNNG